MVSAKVIIKKTEYFVTAGNKKPKTTNLFVLIFIVVTIVNGI